MALFDFNSAEGKQLIRNLYAYGFKLYKSLYQSEINERGKSYKDYVIQALENRLREIDGYDPSKGPLEYFLKYHIIRRALYNDLPPAVKKEYMEWQEKAKVSEAPLILPQPVAVQEVANEELAFFTLSEGDRATLFTEIERLIGNDDVVKRIYVAVAHNSFNFGDRAEICEAYNMTEKEFDNGKRRLRTILRNAFKSLKLI